MSAWCYFNDAVVRPGAMISSLLPSVAYGGLIAYVLLINPLLRRLHSRLALSGREVAAVLALFSSPAAFSAGASARCSPTVMFPTMTCAPIRLGAATTSSPFRQMFAMSPTNGDVGLNGFVTGLGEGDTHINFFRDVPWDDGTAPFSSVGSFTLLPRRCHWPGRCLPPPVVRPRTAALPHHPVRIVAIA